MNEIEDILATRRDFYAFLYRMYVEEPTREFADDLVNGRVRFQELTSLEINSELSEVLKHKKSPIATFARLIDEGAIGVAKSWGGMHIICKFDQANRLRKHSN